jgi:pyruvate dehydrogenase E2 component (dihydrolipoamide acetyltransferase)
VKEARVPDIGSYEGVPVIEILVKPGDTVKKDQGLLTLESDKATMEVPSEVAGVVREVKVKIGDTVSEGMVVVIIDEAAGAAAPAAAPAATSGASTAPAKAAAAPTAASAPPPPGKSEVAIAADAKRDGPPPDPQAVAPGAAVSGATHSPPIAFDAGEVMPENVPYASPSVRLFARELGVDLAQVKGAGRKGRITREDVQEHVKSALSGATSAPRASGGGGGGLDLLPWPKVDFAKFGAVETKPLSRIKKIAGANLSRNWVMIPHVTQNDEADITEMEAFRKSTGEQYKDVKVTPLVFLIKAAVAALKKFPSFNASLDATGENLVLKQYFHIGIAVDTPDGLVVPVIRDADKKGLIDLAQELSAISVKARDRKLGPGDMSGGCFSISSLGGIGGTGFTPIINAPEVAILGVSKSQTKPVWNGKDFAPRLMLPLSLSYDHRVIDGAEAARFTAYLAQVLGDIRRLLL